MVFLEWFIVNFIKVFVYCMDNECYFLLLIIILELSLFINLLFFLISNNFNFLDNILIESIWEFVFGFFVRVNNRSLFSVLVLNCIERDLVFLKGIWWKVVKEELEWKLMGREDFVLIFFVYVYDIWYIDCVFFSFCVLLMILYWLNIIFFK